MTTASSHGASTDADSRARRGTRTGTEKTCAGSVKVVVKSDRLRYSRATRSSTSAREMKPTASRLSSSSSNESSTP